MTGEPSDVVALRSNLQRLHAGLLHWSVSRWSGRAADGRSRVDVAVALILDLAGLGARAGSGAPPGSVPTALGAHALVDQIAVLGAELVAAPGVGDVAADAMDAVDTARRLLLG